MKAKTFTVIGASLFVSMFALSALTWPAFSPTVPALLDPLTIPKYVNQLERPPPVYVPIDVTDAHGNVIRQDYTVNVTEFYQQILPTVNALGVPTGFGPTKVWGYGGIAKDALTGELLDFVRNAPGPTFEAIRGIPINVTWQNKIDVTHMFAVDPTLHWADPNNMGMPMDPFPPFPPGFPDAQSPVPIVTHLHGGEVQSTSDGHPEAWWTWDGKHGSAYNTASPTTSDSAVFIYPNAQQPTTLWYHDHALGITRINVMSGLAGFYLLRDPADTLAPLLPSGEYEMPLVIQDRNFYADGSFYFPSDGNNPDDHPYWQPEFFGDTIMVNGKVWPNMNVDRGQYRFRLLDGSNARFYNLSFSNGMPFVQIGSDGGYLKAPATLTSLTIAPGERADILVDFSSLIPGTKIILQNSAAAPFPDGDPADPNTVGQIMQFTVTDKDGSDPASLPPILNPLLAGSFPSLPMPTRTRILTLVEVMSDITGSPLEILLNGQKWAGDVSELPLLGSTEDWVIVNPTADTHPIHLHLVQFQLVSRQAMDTASYEAEWIALQQGLLGDTPMPPWPLDFIPQELPIEPYLIGSPTPPPPNEQGWKDTVQMNPGEVTVIRVRWASQDGSSFPFDATVGPGYVWHCHILDHEDNEMMRPYMVIVDIRSSDYFGNPKDVFVPGETVYVTVPATGQTVKLYIVVDKTSWNTGDALTDVSSDGPETVALNAPPGTQIIPIWTPPLKVGSYDIVMDVDKDGVFDQGLDLVDSVQVTGFFVVPEVPFGVVMTSLSMFVALAGFIRFKRFRLKRRRQ